MGHFLVLIDQILCLPMKKISKDKENVPRENHRPTFVSTFAQVYGDNYMITLYENSHYLAFFGAYIDHPAKFQLPRVDKKNYLNQKNE